jgi:hypothetical protein
VGFEKFQFQERKIKKIEIVILIKRSCRVKLEKGYNPTLGLEKFQLLKGVKGSVLLVAMWVLVAFSFSSAILCVHILILTVHNNNTTLCVLGHILQLYKAVC